MKAFPLGILCSWLWSMEKTCPCIEGSLALVSLPIPFLKSGALSTGLQSHGLMNRADSNCQGSGGCLWQLHYLTRCMMRTDLNVLSIHTNVFLTSSSPTNCPVLTADLWLGSSLTLGNPHHLIPSFCFCCVFRNAFLPKAEALLWSQFYRLGQWIVPLLVTHS